MVRLRMGLDTLAQRRASNIMIVQGKGGDLRRTKSLKVRTKRKLITQYMTLSLIKLLKESGNETRKWALWNTYHC